MVTSQVVIVPVHGVATQDAIALPNPAQRILKSRYSQQDLTVGNQKVLTKKMCFFSHHSPFEKTV